MMHWAALCWPLRWERNYAMQLNRASSYRLEAAWSSPPASQSLHHRRHTPSRSRAPSSQSAPHSRTLRFQDMKLSTVCAWWLCSNRPMVLLQLSHGQPAARIAQQRSICAVTPAPCLRKRQKAPRNISITGVAASASGSICRPLQDGAAKHPQAHIYVAHQGCQRAPPAG